MVTGRSIILGVILFTTAVQLFAQEQSTSPVVAPPPFGTKRYSPLLAGVASYILPGAGQFYCREPRKGLMFLSVCTASATLAVVGINQLFNYNEGTGVSLFLVGCATYTGFLVWSIVDGVQTASRKNILLQYGPGTTRTLHVLPFIANRAHGSAIGATLTVRF